MPSEYLDSKSCTANVAEADSPGMDDCFNLTIEEVRILAKYRALSRHQQKGILQAIELIKPAELRAGRAPARPH